MKTELNFSEAFEKNDVILRYVTAPEMNALAAS